MGRFCNYVGELLNEAADDQKKLFATVKKGIYKDDYVYATDEGHRDSFTDVMNRYAGKKIKVYVWGNHKKWFEADLIDDTGDVRPFRFHKSWLIFDEGQGEQLSLFD